MNEQVRIGKAAKQAAFATAWSTPKEKASKKRLFALTVAVCVALIVVTAPAAFASTGLGTPLTTQTQAMAGDLKVAQGSTLSAGYDFTMPGSHPAATVGFRGTTVTFKATCASGTPGSQTIVVDISDRSYDDPPNSSAWYPSGDQNAASTYQGSTTVPSFCDPGALVRLQQGGTFSTNVSSTDTQHKVNVRWHYKDGKGGGWSGTYSVIPSVATVCTVTNTRTDLIYSTLQAAQDDAGNGDTLTVQNTCTGTTTISHDLTIEGVAGTSPTLDGNHDGTVLNFDPNLSFTVNRLTIQHGHGINGGGVAIHDGSTFAFNHVNVTDNIADRSGGGFYIDPVDPNTVPTTGSMYDVVITENGAVVGLGVSMVNASLTIDSSVITLNYPIDETYPSNQVLSYAIPAIQYYNTEGALRILHSQVPTIELNGATTYTADAASGAYFTSVVTNSWTASDVLCVTDEQTGLEYPTLQLAQDHAAPGDKLQVNGTCHGQTIFTHNVRVEGPGVLDGDGSVTPVTVTSGVSMYIANMTITNGVGDTGGGVQNDGILDLLHTTVSGNTANGSGGGIANTGIMRLFDSSITGNTAAGSGGGILNSGDFTAKDGSDISNNSAANGGGVWSGPGSFTLIGSTINGNTASGQGGGIYMDGTSILLQAGSTITGNTASDGGGVFNPVGGGTLTTEDTSTITGNTPNDVSF